MLVLGNTTQAPFVMSNDACNARLFLHICELIKMRKVNVTPTHYRAIHSTSTYT